MSIKRNFDGRKHTTGEDVCMYSILYVDVDVDVDEEKRKKKKGLQLNATRKVGGK